MFRTGRLGVIIHKKMADFIIARKMAIFDSKIGQFSKYRDPKSKFAKNGHFLFLNEFGQFLKNVFYS